MRMSGNKQEATLPDSALADAPLAEHEVIATRGNVHRWIEPWYGAYAILGALASGLAVISIPLVITAGGGSATVIGSTIAAQNIGALFAPFWGTVASGNGTSCSTRNPVSNRWPRARAWQSRAWPSANVPCRSMRVNAPYADE